MNNAIQDLCRPGTSYTPRLVTDTLYQMPAGSFDYKGSFDRAARLVQDAFLLNTDTWKMFVEQYRSNVDDENLGWRCEYWGKMMRGSVFTYEYTKDEQLYEVLVGAVEDMLSAQQPSGRFSTYSVECEFDSWDLWGRKYILLGFEYFLDICKSDELKARILKAITAHADYIMKYVGKEEDGKKLITKCTRAWLGLNSSSILEPYVRLYNITGEQKYLDFATYIVECGGISEGGNIFEMAYEDQLDPYEYRTNKAYEMMSCFEGLLEYYRVTGIEKYKTAVINFAKRVRNSDITIIGCSGCTHELFDNSAKNQLNTEYGGIVQETCVTVTWMKYCNQLLSITGDPSFADDIELSAYNAMLGAVNTQKIKGVLAGFPFDSYSPLLYGTRARSTGGFMTMKQGVYGCCACIGSAGTALISLSSAMLSKDGIYMNLYIPGKIHTETPDGNPITISVKTDYPATGKVTLRIDGACGETFKLALRVPHFSKVSTVSVCGEAEMTVNPGYAVLERAWQNGDTVELSLDVRLRTYRHEGIGENAPYHVALYKGPSVLARDARLGEKIDTVVDIVEDENGYVEEIPTNKARFDVDLEYTIPMKDGSTITMVDYASAGKTWGKDSMMTAWLATKDYWSVDLAKPVSLISRNTHLKKFLYAGENGELFGEAIPEKAEAFVFEQTEDGSFYIRHQASGKYITAPRGEAGSDTVTLEDKLDCDCQKWILSPFVQNRYEIISKKNGCHLYEVFGWNQNTYRLYAVTPTADKKYFFDTKSLNIPVAVVFEIKNV